MTNDEALATFEEAGALLTGHFKLSSGLHSDRYLEKFRLMIEPRLAEPMCKDLADRFAEDRIQVVLGPTTAGIILAYNVARHLGVQARFAEREGGEMRLRRGQELAAGARVLVVDDILTTGGAVRECIEIVKRQGAVLAGVGVLGDRSGGTIDLGANLEAVLTLTFEAWLPENCPLCSEGIPIYQPGTKNVQR